MKLNQAETVALPASNAKCDATFYEVTVKFTAIAPSGRRKSVRKKILVQAGSFGKSEEALLAQHPEYEILAIKRTKISECIAEASVIPREASYTLADNSNSYSPQLTQSPDPTELEISGSIHPRLPATKRMPGRRSLSSRFSHSAASLRGTQPYT